MVADFRPPWQWLLLAVAVNLNNALCFFACVAAGRTGQGHLVRHIWVWMFSFAIAQDLASAAGYYVEQQPREALARLLMLPENLIVITGA